MESELRTIVPGIFWPGIGIERQRRCAPSWIGSDRPRGLRQRRAACRSRPCETGPAGWPPDPASMRSPMSVLRAVMTPSKGAYDRSKDCSCSRRRTFALRRRPRLRGDAKSLATGRVPAGNGVLGKEGLTTIAGLGGELSVGLLRSSSARDWSSCWSISGVSISARR